MSVFQLTRVQKNDLFGAIRALGFDHENFVRSTQSGGPGIGPPSGWRKFKISSGEDTYHFDFAETTGYLINVFPPLASRKLLEVPNWLHLVDAFQIWLTSVKSELGTPDLWQSASLSAFYTTDPASYLHEEKFTPGEAEAVRKHLQDIKAFIIERADGDRAKIDRIEVSINHLTDRVAKLSKFDWAGILVSQLLSMLVGFSPIGTAEIQAFCNDRLLPFFDGIFRLN